MAARSLHGRALHSRISCISLLQELHRTKVSFCRQLRRLILPTCTMFRRSGSSSSVAGTFHMRRDVSCQLLDMIYSILECHVSRTACCGVPCQCPIRTVVVTCCRCALRSDHGEGAISWRWQGRSGDERKLPVNLFKFLRRPECKLCSHPCPAGHQLLVVGRRCLRLASSDGISQAATGVWDGPAPRTQQRVRKLH